MGERGGLDVLLQWSSFTDVLFEVTVVVTPIQLQSVMIGQALLRGDHRAPRDKD